VSAKPIYLAGVANSLILLWIVSYVTNIGIPEKWYLNFLLQSVLWSKFYHLRIFWYIYSDMSYMFGCMITWQIHLAEQWNNMHIWLVCTFWHCTWHYFWFIFSGRLTWGRGRNWELFEEDENYFVQLSKYYFHSPHYKLSCQFILVTINVGHLSMNCYISVMCNCSMWCFVDMWNCCLWYSANVSVKH
jgi:hypothetical protein